MEVAVNRARALARAAGGPGAGRRMAVLLAAVLLAGAWSSALPAGRAHAVSGQIDAHVSVRGPADEAWSQATDTFLGQEAGYRAWTEVPDGVSIDGKCKLRLETAMEGIAEPDASSVRVTVDGVDVTSRMTWGDLGGLVVGQPSVMVEFWDVLRCGWAGEGSVVAVEFEAANSGETDASGRIRGKCGAMASYSAGSGSGGWANAAAAYNHTYTAVVRAVDSATGEALPGGSFAARVAAYADDAGVEGKYLDGAGGLSDVPVELACDGDGEVRVAGLDGATYEIVQAAAAPGHSASPAIALGLSPSFDAATGEVSSLGASVAGGTGASVESADASSGTVVVLAPAEAGAALPATGLARGAALRGAAARAAAAAAVLAALALAGRAARAAGRKGVAMGV